MQVTLLWFPTGLRSLNPEILQLSSIFKETIAAEPILLLSTSGTDPSSEIKDLTRSKIGEEKYIEVSCIGPINLIDLYDFWSNTLKIF